jgi:ABC-type nitrate/sulfonate/bicarbonate transport system permease component
MSIITVVAGVAVGFVLGVLVGEVNTRKKLLDRRKGTLY